jgi:hypothetical protein
MPLHAEHAPRPVTLAWPDAQEAILRPGSHPATTWSCRARVPCANALPPSSGPAIPGHDARGPSTPGPPDE